MAPLVLSRQMADDLVKANSSKCQGTIQPRNKVHTSSYVVQTLASLAELWVFFTLLLNASVQTKQIRQKSNATEPFV
jgi:hypothetical protein